MSKKNKDNKENKAVPKTQDKKKGKKKGAAPCGLYIKIGPDIDLETVTKDLKQILFVINRSEYERNMHALEVNGDFSDKDFTEKARLVITMAKQGGLATLVRGTAEHAETVEADGVLTLNLEDMKEAKSNLGEEAIVGLYCGLSQDDAAAAYDAGADFVSFGTKSSSPPAPDTLKFWNMLTDKPAVVEGHITNDYCAYYVQAGAGFIDAGDYIWSVGRGVMQGTVNMLHAIELALDEMRT